MSVNNREKAIITTRFRSRLYSCRTIVRILLSVTVSVFIISCGPSSVNHYHGPDKNLVNENTQTRGGGGGGTGDGGGGQGIACSGEVKDDKLKNRLFVRDIFEAIINHRRTMKSVEGTAESSDKVDAQAIQVLVNSIKYHFGPATPNLEFGNEKFWTEFAEKISFLNEDTPLFPSNDANSPIALPVGCQITQIAYWDESAGSASEGTLYVDRKRWQQLDQFNKIALLAHEYFFKQARKAGYKNSDFIRYKVGQLLSVEGLEPIFKEWIPAKDPRVKDILPESKNGFKYCTGTSAEDPTAELQFYQYEGKDKRQHFVIPFIKSNTINSSLFESGHFNFDPIENKRLGAGTDHLIYGSDFADTLGKSNFKKYYLEDEARYGLYFNLWYFGSGLLFKNGVIVSAVSVKQDLISSFNILRNSNQTVLWTEFVNSKSHPIKVSFLNPYPNHGPILKGLKTKESLVAVVNKKIQRLIEKLFPFEEIEIINDVMFSKVSNAIATLNSEIDLSIHNGIYPERFSKWNNILSDLEANSKRKYTDQKEKGEFKLDYSRLTNELPNFLYQIKLNNYDEKDIETKLGDDGFDSLSRETLDSLGFVKFLIQQGNSSLNFEMTCKDYPTVFSSAMSKNTISATPELKEDIAYELNSFDTEKKAVNEILVLLKTLTGKENKPEKYRQFWNVNYENCDTLAPVKDSQCDDLLKLDYDLRSETKISAYPCESYNDRLGMYDEMKETNIDDYEGVVRNFCTIIKLHKSMNSYLIYAKNYYKNIDIQGGKVSEPSKDDANSDDDGQFIYFIRQIPF